MTMVLEVPNEYGYVILTGVLTIALSSWHGSRVISYRRAAGVPLPYPYATPEQLKAAETPEKQDALFLFNCAQRAHYNYIENHVLNLVLLLIAGLRYPRMASATCLFWVVNRILYAVGYTDKNKRDGGGRYLGGLHVFGYLAQMAIAAKVGYDMIVA